MKFLCSGAAVLLDSIDAVIDGRNIERENTEFIPGAGRTEILTTVCELLGLSEEENHET